MTDQDKITGLVNGGAGIQTQAFWLRKSKFLTILVIFSSHLQVFQILTLFPGFEAHPQRVTTPVPFSHFTLPTP